ncbi:phage tail protein [Pseudomonas fragi]|uniref:phage tail protein n=1 Tax=Pseudomonas fragi TaxID=296 RepID=UPI0020CBD6F5|nr:phage tail protein [Pseudomonas fragi]
MIDANSQFFATLTNVGMAKQANADALGIPWKITEMGVGDANGTDPIPSVAQTKLINEWRRRPLNQLRVDPANPAVIIAEQVIPADEGGKWIREIALYDADGDLVAVANCAPSFKPLLSQGSGRTQVVRLNFQVNSTGNITLKIDPAVVLATRSYVDNVFNTIIEVFAQRSAYDGAPGRLAKVGYMGWGSSYVNGPLLVGDMTGDQTIFSGLYRYSPQTVGRPEFGEGYGSVLQSSLSNAGGNWATQLVIDYASDAIGFRRLSGPLGWMPFQEIWHRGNLKAATQDQTNSGVDDVTFVTPKKFSAGLTALIVQATEAIKGIARVATQSQTNSGVDDTTMITPKKFSAGIAALVIQATETVTGIARVATQVQTDAGTNDTTLITPKKLRWGFQILKASQGYVVFPTWLGGFIIQWGYSSIPAGATTTAFPLTYPAGCLSVVVTPFNTTGYADVVELTAAPAANGFSAVGVSSGAAGNSAQTPANFLWLSVGY